MDALKNMTRELLLRYMQDECPPEQAEQVRVWLQDNLHDPKRDQLFCDLLDATEIAYDPEGKNRVWRKLDAIISACPASTLPLRKSRPRWLRPALRMAEFAAVLICLVLVFHYRHQANTPRQWVEVCAEVGERREVVLPDSSHIWLNAGSKLIYPQEFNRTLRQIYLSGEMYADIRHDEQRPFVVSSDRLQVQVLGTQFNLKSYQEDSKSEVSLVRGKVSVSINATKMSGSLTLSPGDILRFDKTDNRIDFLNFDPDSYTNWTDNGNFFFVEQTLGDIVADLRRHFAVDILITEKSLREETYYASFVNHETLDEILNALNQDQLFSVRKDAEVYYISSPLK